MARIVDKDTRLIDVDFGPVSVTASRNVGDLSASSATTSGNGVNQIIRVDSSTGIVGSFVQYQRIDLDYMTLNNEVMMPTEVVIQRTSPIPLGFSNNGNNVDQIEEYIYVFSRPLNNETIRTSTATFDQFRDLGLDRSQIPTGVASIGGVSAGLPNQTQTIYAEKRIYSYSDNLLASVNNGELIDPRTATPPTPLINNTLAGMPVLDSITTWGSLDAITGPNLHCYRVVINRTQMMPTNDFVNTTLGGGSVLKFPPVNVAFVCTDPKYTEGELLTRLANAMNSTPIDGDTA